MRLEGSKMGFYIVIIGEGKPKGHQITSSLPLGNIIGNLTLPQLIPHFSNLHWWMDNSGLLYQIERGLEHNLLRHIGRESPWSHVNPIGFRLKI